VDERLLVEAAILGIVEGLTEFLPVSSTGHLILADYLIAFADPTNRVFHVVIQLGAIVAVCLLYLGRLWRVTVGLPTSARARRFVLSLLVAFLPAAVLGAMFHGVIKNVLFSPWVVPVTLILGGIAILVVERLPREVRYGSPEELPLVLALKVGFCQALAMVPGVSRSGATILGAVVLGVERRAAAEFSFFLAIPTMLGAATFDLFKARGFLVADDLLLIAIGFVAAMLSAMAVVRALLAYLARHTFEVFGWYRIVAGTAMLLLLAWRGTERVAGLG
jgi:undecaprenyl-diphosphatase